MKFYLCKEDVYKRQVLGKTTRDNFKTKRKRIANEDELLVFYNTHEALSLIHISQFLVVKYRTTGKNGVKKTALVVKK